MRRSAMGWAVAAAVLILSGFGWSERRPAAPPRLVVLISVDQLRADLVTRYDRFYTGGFRRLLDEGAYFTGVHDHAGSETGPGHATLATGVVPARSGIVANQWEERVDGRWVEVYNVADSLAPIVGMPGAAGMSPRNLLRTGVADWIAQADPRARVASVSGKDRSAILMAGKARGQVYWFDQGAGRFITSTFYAKKYPDWVERFNARAVPALLDTVWTETSPAAARPLARPDTAAYESDGTHTHFPHTFADEGNGVTLSQWAGTTPMIDRAVLGLAEQAIENLGLGRDGVPDYLSVGLSQTDYVGHRYGPLSREQLDNLMRLDAELGAFFAYLDTRVGRGRWVAVLSADHGSTTMPEWRATHGEPGFRMTAEDRAKVAGIAALAAGQAKADTAGAVAAALRQLPLVADAYTFDELEKGSARDSFATLFAHSFHAGRVAGPLGEYGVEVRWTEGTYSGGAGGTGHGSAYVYDRAVPIVFLGGGIPAHRFDAPARTVDVAPTLARLAGVEAPSDLDGHVLPVTPELR